MRIIHVVPDPASPVIKTSGSVPIVYSLILSGVWLTPLKGGENYMSPSGIYLFPLAPPDFDSEAPKLPCLAPVTGVPSIGIASELIGSFGTTSELIGIGTPMPSAPVLAHLEHASEVGTHFRGGGRRGIVFFG